MAAALEPAGIFCEVADPDYIVFMLSPENTDGELERLEGALTQAFPLGGRWHGEAVTDEGTFRQAEAPNHPAGASEGPSSAPVCALGHLPPRGKALGVSLREALLGPAVRVPAGESLGRVLARPGVSCPPAVPILMPGEVIDEAAIEAFGRYGIEEIGVLPYLFSSP